MSAVGFSAWASVPEGARQDVIRFQCSCGLTLSAEDGRRGSAVTCGECGAVVEVPRGVVGAGEVAPRTGPSRPHDFDAEIVSASRSRPGRPRKTPGRVDRPGGAPADPGDRSPPPPFDLERVRQAPRLVGVVAWLALVLLLAAAVAVFLAWPGSLRARCVGSVAILVLAGAVFVALQVLKEVCRAVSGLADQQRGILARVTDEEE